MSIIEEVVLTAVRIIKEKGWGLLGTAIFVAAVSGIFIGLIGFENAISMSEKGLIVSVAAVIVLRFAEEYMSSRSKIIRIRMANGITKYLIKQSKGTKPEKSEIRKAALSLAYVEHLRAKSLKVRSILLALFIAFICIWLYEPQYKTMPLAITCLTSNLAFTLHLWILQYRVKKGYFGRSESEARKFIKYIEENSETIDFNDGDGLRRKIFEKVVDIKQISSPISGGASANG